jgi:hypothetical protein
MNWIPIDSSMPQARNLHAFEETETTIRAGVRAACGYTMLATDRVSSLLINDDAEDIPLVCRACAAMHPWISPLAP